MDRALLARRAAQARPSPIDAVFQSLAGRDDVVSFAAGSPDTSLLPVDLLADMARRALDRYGPRVLQYGSTLGFEPLREAVLPLLAGRGIHVGADEVHISTGGTGGLGTLCACLLQPGSTVLVESPTYSLALQAFRSWGAHVVAVTSDEQGLRPDALQDQLRRRGPAVVYLLPTFQNPTGRTMSAARRAAVADVVVRNGALVLEDDVYTDLRFEGDPLPAVKSYAPDHVAYVTSLSKTFAPALRTGVVVPPAALLDPLVALKASTDMQTSSLTQAVSAEFLASSRSGEHLRHAVATYRRKRDLMAGALSDHLPPGILFRRPAGGLFVWLEGPDELDTGAVAERALDAGVAVMPGTSFHADSGSHHRELRLNFASPPADRIGTGVAVLARVLGEALGG